MLQSQKQALRLRRAVHANLGILLNVPLCVLASYLDYILLSPMYVALLTMALWLGHVFLVVLISTQINLRFKDASLTLLQMLWVILGLSILMYFVRDIRPLMLMGYLLVMAFGAFRLSVKGFYGVTAFTLICYIVTIGLVYLNHPQDIDVGEEFFIFVGFLFALFGFTFMGMEFSHLRKVLGDRHRELKGAVSKIAELAITDELTGLHNRRHLMDVLGQQRALANRSRYGFVVCYIDLDHFKKVNDQYGHPFGDKVLRAFSALIRRSLREVDIGARLGGEEFVLILADIQLDAARKVCERMADSWMATHFADAPDLLLTLSAGIAEYQSPETVEQLLERADSLLYEAKNSGRNCIMVEQVDRQVALDFSLPQGEPEGV